MSALITLTRAKQNTDLAALSDGRLTSLIAIASEMAQKECHRSFLSSERIEVYDGDGTDNLILKEFPITEISEVAFSDDGSDWTVQTSTDFDHNDDLGVLYYSKGRFPDRRRSVRVTYTAGWTLENMPETIQEAVVQLMVVVQSDNDQDQSVTSESLGGYSYTKSSDDSIPPSIFKLLKNYRDRKF